MKKIICLIVLTALVLTAFAGCAKTNEEETEKNVDDIETLLPSFDGSNEKSNYKSNDGNYVEVKYENVTPKDLKRYIKELKNVGFECDEFVYDALLRKDDIVVSITNNTKAYSKCDVRISRNEKTKGGLSMSEVMALVSDDRVFYACSISDQDFFDETGIQRFEVYYKMSEYYYGTWDYLLGKNGAERITVMGGSEYLRDLDGDGKTEIVITGIGPTSGVSSVAIAVYSYEDCKPHLIDGLILPGTTIISASEISIIDGKIVFNGTIKTEDPNA
ncbi:MAG: hypothetical protein IKP68_01190 [Clostridia bacterium]|nr:hypothetical protein [Clostridia bacterium]